MNDGPCFELPELAPAAASGIVVAPLKAIGFGGGCPHLGVTLSLGLAAFSFCVGWAGGFGAPRRR